MQTKAPLLNVQNLSWGIANKPILKHINVQIPEGKFVGLIGPNGAGKSSLLRCLYRFNKPNEGVIEFNNHDIWQLKSDEYAKCVAVVLQEAPSHFNLSLFDVVALGLTPHKSLFSSTSQSEKQQITLAIKTVGLELHTPNTSSSMCSVSTSAGEPVCVISPFLMTTSSSHIALATLMLSTKYRLWSWQSLLVLQYLLRFMILIWLALCVMSLSSLKMEK